MTITRTARAALAGVLALTMLAGCRMPGTAATTPTWPDPGALPGQSLNCLTPPKQILRARIDVNNDGAPDWIYVLRCMDSRESQHSDQIEALDGHAGTGQPRRLGKGSEIPPVVHVYNRFHMTGDGCLAFAPGRIVIADGQGKTPDGEFVTVFAVWQDGQFVVRHDDHPDLVPCRLLRPAETPVAGR